MKSVLQKQWIALASLAVAAFALFAALEANRIARENSVAKIVVEHYEVIWTDDPVISACRHADVPSDYLLTEHLDEKWTLSNRGGRSVALLSVTPRTGFPHVFGGSVYIKVGDHSRREVLDEYHDPLPLELPPGGAVVITLHGSIVAEFRSREDALTAAWLPLSWIAHFSDGTIQEVRRDRASDYSNGERASGAFGVDSACAE